MTEGRYEDGKKEGEEGKRITTTDDQYLLDSPTLLITAA